MVSITASLSGYVMQSFSNTFPVASYHTRNFALIPLTTPTPTPTPTATPFPTATPTPTPTAAPTVIPVSLEDSSSQPVSDVVLRTQFFYALDYSVSTNGNERSSAVSVKNLVGYGVTTGGYKISGTNNPQLAFKGVVPNAGNQSVEQEEFYYLTAQSYYDTAIKSVVSSKPAIAYKTTTFYPGLPLLLRAPRITAGSWRTGTPTLLPRAKMMVESFSQSTRLQLL